MIFVENISNYSSKLLTLDSYNVQISGDFCSKRKYK